MCRFAPSHPSPHLLRLLFQLSVVYFMVYSKSPFLLHFLVALPVFLVYNLKLEEVVLFYLNVYFKNHSTTEKEKKP